MLWISKGKGLGKHLPSKLDNHFMLGFIFKVLGFKVRACLFVYWSSICLGWFGI